MANNHIGSADMNNLQITDLKVVPCDNSPYIKTERVTFKQNGTERQWDYIKVHDSVFILLYNTCREAFVLIKQFRPALFMAINREQSTIGEKLSREIGVKDDTHTLSNTSYHQGVAYELCAGLVDKPISLIEVAREEVFEECGYDVPAVKIQKVTSWWNEVGHESSKHTLFYAEVTNDMIVSGAGGGCADEGEYIEVFYLPTSKMRTFMYNEDVHKESSLVLAFLWWIDNIQMQKQ